MRSKVTDQQLKDMLREIQVYNNQHTTGKAKKVSANNIAYGLEQKLSITIDPSTIRGRFIAMGTPLGGKQTPSSRPVGPTPPPFELNEPIKSTPVKPTPPPTPPPTIRQINIPTIPVADELKPYIPMAKNFGCYVQRDIDTKLALMLDLQAKGLDNKYPIAQGKQGTGKTLSYMFYAHKRGLPFFLWSAYEDFNIRKLYGDRTIINGTVKFQESVFVKAIQHPSVILIDEVNAISEANIKDFNALLQNRELYIKDADDSKGKLYKLHEQCRIGFAMNPKSAKYVGGKIRSSDFLGRCTYITYPEFSRDQLQKALQVKYDDVDKQHLKKFASFYMGCVSAIEQNRIPVDISIRQLSNTLDAWLHGMSLGDSIELGMLNIMDSISQPQSRDAFLRVAQMTWKDLM